MPLPHSSSSHFNEFHHHHSSSPIPQFQATNEPNEIQVSPASPFIEAQSSSPSTEHSSQHLIHEFSTQQCSHIIDSSLNHTGFGLYHILISVLCVASWSVDGSQPMTLSLIMPILKELWNLQSHHISLMVFALYSGMLCGSLIFGWLSDRFGRKSMLLVTNTGVCAAILAQSFSASIWMLIACLFLNGLFAGGSLPLVYSYYTEFMPLKGRGFYLTCLACSWSVGELLVSGFAWAFIDRVGFRWVVRYSMWPCLLVFALLPCALTSPRYLLKRGRRERSLRVLRKVARFNCVDEHSVGHFVEEMAVECGAPSNEISDSFQYGRGENVTKVGESHNPAEPHPDDMSASKYQANGQVSHEDMPFQLTPRITTPSNHASNQFKYGRFVGLFLSGYYKPTLTLWALWFLASVSLYCIQVFLPEFTAKKGITIGTYPLIFLSSCGNIPGVVGAALLIDWLGRKPSLLLFCVGCALALIPFGFFNNFWLMLVFLVCAKFFMYGAWGILDAIVPETYPTTNRSVGNACANAWARIAGMVTPFLLEGVLLRFDSVWPALGMASGVIFVTGLVAMSPWLPETKGKEIV